MRFLSLLKWLRATWRESCSNNGGKFRNYISYLISYRIISQIWSIINLVRKDILCTRIQKHFTCTDENIQKMEILFWEKFKIAYDKFVSYFSTFSFACKNEASCKISLFFINKSHSWFVIVFPCFYWITVTASYLNTPTIWSEKKMLISPSKKIHIFIYKMSRTSIKYFVLYRQMFILRECTIWVFLAKL